MKTRTRLRDILQLADSGTWGDSADDNCGSPVLRSSNIQGGRIVLTDVARIIIPANDVKRKQLFDGDILVTKSSGSSEHIGKCAMFREFLCSESCYFSNFTLRLRVNQSVADTRWLYYWLISSQGRAILQSLNSTTSGLRNLNIVRYLDQVIPLPQIDEQRRIAAILDKADEICRKRQGMASLVNEIQGSVFNEMFGDPVSNSKGWPRDSFGNLGELDRGRSRHRPRNAPQLYGGPYPFIQTGDVANCQNYIREYQQTYSELGLEQSRLWKAGTLCITIAANIAKTGILTFDACFPDSIVGFQPCDRVSIEYVHYWLKFMQQRLENAAPESAQKNINLEILRKLSVPVPPITLQKKFSRVVSQTNKLSQRLDQSMHESENMFNSLQRDLF